MFLCVIVYRLFVLNFWCHRHREYQLVAKSTVPCFLNSCVIFTMSVFHCGMPPLCPRNWGGGHNANLGGTLKKNFPALCAPNFKTVSAPTVISLDHACYRPTVPERLGDVSCIRLHTNRHYRCLYHGKSCETSIVCVYFVRCVAQRNYIHSTAVGYRNPNPTLTQWLKWFCEAGGLT